MSSATRSATSSTITSRVRGSMLEDTNKPRDSARTVLRRAIAAAERPCYLYGCPSERAYRPILPERTLAEIWSSARGELNLYIHIPFCAYRCSFCTLFLTTSHSPDLVTAYVEALRRQIAMYGALLGHLRVVSLYVGGGTPTTLSEAQF